ncbi:MAG: carbohydrate kinase family protein [Christensenellales bacterium]
MRVPDVVCVGNSAVDVPLRPVDESIFTTDSYPVDRIVPTVGGSGTNVTTILRRLGVSAKLITMLGQDMLGDFLVEHCRRNGVDTADIVRNSDVDTPLSIGLVQEDGERTFVVSRGSSTFHFHIDHVNLAALKGAKILAVASIFIMPKFDDDGLTRLFSAAKSEGLIICADMMKSRTGQRMDAIENALSYIDYFFANYDEAAFLTGLERKEEIADKLLGTGAGHVIIKEGRKGCYVKGPYISEVFPAYVNENPVDTIGAGDNFAAGFIAGLLDNRSIADCARFANAAAAISVSAPGSTGGVKDKRQVLEFIRNNRQEAL